MRGTDNRIPCTEAHRHASKTKEPDGHRQVDTCASPAQLKELRRLAALCRALTDLLVRSLSKVR